MTGYGRGTAERAAVRVQVEIRAVNHRFLDLKLRTGGLSGAVEERIANRVRSRLRRGSIAVTVRTDGGGPGAGIVADLEVGRRVHRELTELADTLGVGPVSLELVCAQPGVLSPAQAAEGDDAIAACAEEAADAALDALVAMREAEGATLARDLDERLERAAGLVEQLETRAARAPGEAARRLEERIERLLHGKVEVDEGRLAQEVALLADRQDVTEELVRARSHLDQLRDIASASDEAIGRRLDFLVQELGREVNTVSSKSQSAEIARLVVDVKAELEKLREQVQNIE